MCSEVSFPSCSHKEENITLSLNHCFCDSHFKQFTSPSNSNITCKPLDNNKSTTMHIDLDVSSFFPTNHPKQLNNEESCNNEIVITHLPCKDTSKTNFVLPKPSSSTLTKEQKCAINAASTYFQLVYGEEQGCNNNVCCSCSGCNYSKGQAKRSAAVVSIVSNLPNKNSSCSQSNKIQKKAVKQNKLRGVLMKIRDEKSETINATTNHEVKNEITTTIIEERNKESTNCSNN